ncbi:MAG: cell envelope integrity EipB family protein [Rhodobiaceae bacterium]|nr:cell envelope integrity EipB family protein [Rhodobiaceae bacterium]
MRVIDWTARGLLVAGIMGSAYPALAAELVAHRAVYELELARSQSSADLAGLRGRMVLEWAGSSCEGYTLTQRLVTQISDSDGGQMVRDLRMSSWESGDGNEFVFEMKRYVNNSLDETVSGSAARSDKAAIVHYTSPADGELALPASVVFPSEFVRDVIAAAESGQTLVTAEVFEGAETDKYFQVSVFTGRSSVAETDLAKLSGDGKQLAGEASWPVQVSYFLPDDLQGVPDYQVSYRLFPNGVSSNMKLDYGDVVIDGRLTELTYLPSDPC